MEGVTCKLIVINATIMLHVKAIELCIMPWIGICLLVKSRATEWAIWFQIRYVPSLIWSSFFGKSLNHRRSLTATACTIMWCATRLGSSPRRRPTSGLSQPNQLLCSDFRIPYPNLKATKMVLLLQGTARGRGRHDALIHVLQPQLWSKSQRWRVTCKGRVATVS